MTLDIAITAIIAKSWKDISSCQTCSMNQTFSKVGHIQNKARRKEMAIEWQQREKANLNVDTEIDSYFIVADYTY